MISKLNDEISQNSHMQTKQQQIKISVVFSQSPIYFCFELVIKIRLRIVHKLNEQQLFKLRYQSSREQMQKQKIAERLLRADSDSDPRSVLGRSQILRIFVFEVIGTFILAFGITCSQYVPPLHLKTPNPFHDVFISLSLYLAIVIGAPFCGGHINPAVSFGFYFLKQAKMSTGKLVTYIIAQFIGAIIGVTLAKIFFDCQIAIYPQSVGVFTLIGHCIGQMLGGFLFIFMILTVVNPQTTFIYEPSWAHMFIPLSLFVARSFSYHIGGVNPAVVTILQMQSFIVHHLSWVTLLEVIILEIACIVGAIIASIFYQKLYRPTFVKND